MVFSGGKEDNSEVRPILKKKHSREESSQSDPPPQEPRPILKKKSSTESDEHEEKPKKTILKCSRKNSQEDPNSESDLSSPKKLSALKNCMSSRKSDVSYEDSVKPILKQTNFRDSSSRPRLNFCGSLEAEGTSFDNIEQTVLRKRAQSISQVHSSNSRDEFSTSVGKKVSLETDLFSNVQLKGGTLMQSEKQSSPEFSRFMSSMFNGSNR